MLWLQRNSLLVSSWEVLSTTHARAATRDGPSVVSHGIRYDQAAPTTWHCMHMYARRLQRRGKQGCCHQTIKLVHHAIVGKLHVSLLNNADVILGYSLPLCVVLCVLQ
jgi:hypothetical protein